MLYDIVQLRSFVAICDNQSFTKAARAVNLTQSAVSLHVKRLEDQIGCRLFERNARQVQLTADGEILLSYARRILSLNAEVESQLNRRQASGLVRLGAPEYFDPQTLSSLLGQFMQRYPNVRIAIELGIGPDIAALFDKGELDLAIVNREIGDGDGLVLRRDGRIWAAASQMALDPAAPIPLAVFPSHCGWRRLALEELDRAGRAWTLNVQGAGLAGLTAAIEAGLAVGIFPAGTLPKGMRALGTSEGLPKLPDFEYVLRRKSKLSPAAGRLAEVIVDFFQFSAALRERHRQSARDPSLG